jgi:rubrerythrin
MEWATEHKVGAAKGASAAVIEGLRANYNGECAEVGMYLAMARVAHREGYPEIGLYWERRRSRKPATRLFLRASRRGRYSVHQKNLEMRVGAENGACKGKLDLAAMAEKECLYASATP